MENIISTLSVYAVDIAGKLILSIIILFIGLKLVKLIVKLITKGVIFQNLDPAVQTFLKSFLSIAFKVLVIITAAGVLGVNMASFITIFGSVAVAIGLSLQGSLSNIAGGLIILIFKPFKIGDFITVCGESGTVSEIGIFYTHLKTVDNKKIIIPNSNVTNDKLINASAQNIRRVDISVSVGYESDIDKVKNILTDIANAHPMVIDEPEPPLARLSNHGDSALEFAFRVWCKAENYWAVKFDLNETIKKEFDKNNISIPYPQLDVHIDK